ncbi:MAG: ABC transporter permease [Phycisphaeraceae bacterium]
MNNPIIQRELIGMLRTRRALVLQLLLVAALGLLIVMRWPSEAHVDFTFEQSLQVLRVFGYGVMVGLILLAPVFPATSIVAEKQQGTLALLLNSPMSAPSIFLGKLAGSMGYVLLLIALTLPAAAACFAMGGVGIDQVARMYLVLVMLALMYTTLGLLVSSYASSTDSALRLTYGLILLMAVVTLGPHQFLAGSPLLSDNMLAGVDWLRAVSPIPAMMQVMGDTGYGGGGIIGFGDAAGRFALVALVASVVFSVWTTTRLNQRIFDRSRDPGKVTDDASAGQRAYRRVMYLWFFDPRRRSELIGFRPLAIIVSLAVAFGIGSISIVWFMAVDLEGDILAILPYIAVGVLPGVVGLAGVVGSFWMILNGVPTAVKEQKTNRFGRSHWMMRLIASCLIVSLGLMLLTVRQTIGWGVEELGGIMVVLQMALILLLTPSLAAGIISQERESGGWQLLQMTPLSSLAIVAGKLLSVCWTLGLVLIATLPAYLVLIAVEPGMQWIAFQVLTSLVLTALLALLVSAAVSSLMPTTAASTAVSYTVLLTLCVGTLLFWLAQDAPFAHSTVQAVLLVNPLAAGLSIIEAPGFASYHLTPANWWIVGAICLICLVTLVVRTWYLTRPR